MRCDVNISVRRAGEPQLGTKVEIKNMNSFAAMQKAIDYEFQRQVRLALHCRGHPARLAASACSPAASQAQLLDGGP